MQFSAGILLSFGGLLSEIIQGGSPALNTANPGLVKVMGGFVFPVGLVMYVVYSFRIEASTACSIPEDVERDRTLTVGL